MAWFWRKPPPKNPQLPLTQPNEQQAFVKRADPLALFPVTEEEHQRLEFQHHMMHSLLHGNYLAPLQDPLSILDIGCGTGNWAIEMASAFPRANVVGVDIARSPKHEKALERLGNYVYVQADIHQGLPFIAQQFSYVHIRFMTSAIPQPQWMLLLQEVERVTHLGGWIELVDSLPAQQAGPMLRRVERWMTQSMSQRGIDPFHARFFDYDLEYMRLAHTVSRDIVTPLQIPSGRSIERLSTLAVVNLQATVHALRPALLTLPGVSVPLFESTLDALQNELLQKQPPALMQFRCAYGQKTGSRR
ncbi:MAG: methyltransferase domain-containing protein [Ktedonobacteraceae bacterium]|nr:methyltransferase domain-containing protein [Ktedonobacteraceae bacterium]